MRIAIVFDGLQYGGIERVGVDYIKLFKKNGHEVTAFNLDPKLKDLESELEGACAIEHFSFPRWLAPERTASALNKTAWGKYIYPISFLICNLLVWLYRIILFLTKESVRKTYDISIAFSGHINDLTVVANSIVKGKKKVAWLHGALYGYAIISPGFLRLYSKIKNLVSLSDSCDAEMYKYIGENEINKKTIYNPIYISGRELNTSLIKDLHNEYGDFCLMVGRLENQKDQKTAIDAITILNNKYGMSKKLVLVGDGINRDKLEQYVKKMNASDYVFFTGNRNDVQNFYSAATVYVHSSPLEGLPTVLLEAMNYRLPIASTDSIPGVREILGNDKCGLISPIFDAVSLADNIFRLYTDIELRNSLVQAGEKRIQDFSPEVIERQILNYLRELK